MPGRVRDPLFVALALLLLVHPDAAAEDLPKNEIGIGVGLSNIDKTEAGTRFGGPHVSARVARRFSGATLGVELGWFGITDHDPLVSDFIIDSRGRIIFVRQPAVFRTSVVIAT